MSAMNGTSFVEQTLFYYIKKYMPDAQNRYKLKSKDATVEIDIYIPSLNVAIEYDGSYWHEKKKDVDNRKNKILNNEGLYVIRLREHGLPELSAFNGLIINLTGRWINEKVNFDYINKTLHALADLIDDIELSSLLLKTELDEKQYEVDLPQIYLLAYAKEVKPNLSDLCGIEYWNQERNFPLVPENIPRDGWVHAFILCPANTEMLLPRYRREYKSLCVERNEKCEMCLFHLLCPYLRHCARRNGNDLINCEHVEKLVWETIKTGGSYREFAGHSTFSMWLFYESNLGMTIIKEFLLRPKKSKYRKNIIRFLELDTIVSTSYPAWSQEAIDLLVEFRQQSELSDVKIRIRDMTNGIENAIYF